MKLRLRGNSVRLRLTQSEVKRFMVDGVVKEKTSFGSAVFSYSLRRSQEIPALTAQYDANEIALLVPEKLALEWASSAMVSLVHEVKLADGEGLRLLVEKDFLCINPQRAWQEDESDAYSNPNPPCGG